MQHFRQLFVIPVNNVGRLAFFQPGSDVGGFHADTPRTFHIFVIAVSEVQNFTKGNAGGFLERLERRRIGFESTVILAA